MKYCVALKFLAMLLCAACLLASIGAGIGIAALVECNLYNSTAQELKLESLDHTVFTAARLVAKRYLTETVHPLPSEIADRYLTDYYEQYGFFENVSGWYYTIADEKGNLIETNVDQAEVADALVYETVVDSMTYPVVLDYEFINPYTAQDPTDATMPPESFIDNTIQPPDEETDFLYVENWGYQDRTGIHQYRLGISHAPTYTVTLYLTSGTYFLEDSWVWEIVEFGYANRYNVIWALGASLLLFVVLYVYLCCAAGRKPKSEELRPGGFNRIPLDLYALATGAAGIGACILTRDLISWTLEYFEPKWLLLLGIVAAAYMICLLVVGFLFACAAQFKMRKFYCFKHSVVGFTIILCWKVLKKVFGWIFKGIKWLFGKLPLTKNAFVFLKKVVLWLLKSIWATFQWVWKLLKAILGGTGKLLKKILGTVWHILRRFTQLLPLTWQWLLVGLVMIFALRASFRNSNTNIQLLGMAVCICIIMYGAHCFGILLEATKRMSKGDLDIKVEDKLLLGGFQEYATGLNTLAGVAVEAAKNQMKSERMKAELVTNVSHDIKTPLTSIINYVDLLKKAENQEEANEYLAVLDRQSLRLKKLIEDLMEMSKATTGNMAVELTRVNAVEAINQALGEFSEKLEMAQLTPVFMPPAEPMMMTADGRLTWRVLSNLLGNAVKYALPGTRLYIDLVAVEGHVLISLKNISKEQLNVSSEELMERFVRGDASRNTEGSGLGLNIAKSLMELQKGQLQLLVDGDLFKATLLFPEN